MPFLCPHGSHSAEKEHWIDKIRFCIGLSLVLMILVGKSVFSGLKQVFGHSSAPIEAIVLRKNIPLIKSDSARSGRLRTLCSDSGQSARSGRLRTLRSCRGQSARSGWLRTLRSCRGQSAMFSTDQILPIVHYESAMFSTEQILPIVPYESAMFSTDQI